MKKTLTFSIMLGLASAALSQVSVTTTNLAVASSRQIMVTDTNAIDVTTLEITELIYAFPPKDTVRVTLVYRDGDEFISKGWAMLTPREKDPETGITTVYEVKLSNGLETRPRTFVLPAEAVAGEQLQVGKALVTQLATILGASLANGSALLGGN
jgi:hypothetical protein